MTLYLMCMKLLWNLHREWPYFGSIINAKHFFSSVRSEFFRLTLSKWDLRGHVLRTIFNCCHFIWCMYHVLCKSDKLLLLWRYIQHCSGPCQPYLCDTLLSKANRMGLGNSLNFCHTFRRSGITENPDRQCADDPLLELSTLVFFP